jgi:hypothetical protein
LSVDSYCVIMAFWKIKNDYNAWLIAGIHSQNS